MTGPDLRLVHDVDAPTPPSHISPAVPAAHDLDAEAAVLSAVMIDGSLVASLGFLKADHFYAEAHRRIFEACLDLRDHDQPLDNVQVATWLKNRDRLEQVGGMGYLTEILNAAPAIAERHVVAHARGVVELAERRQLTSTLRELVAASVATSRTTGELIAKARRSIERFERSTTPLTPDARVAETAPDVVARWQHEGHLERRPIGFKTLDDACRGGLAFPWRVVIVGAPSAGKTFLVTQAARALALQGVAVGHLAVDEEPDDVVVRHAQMAGFTVDECEERDPEVLDRIRKQLEDLSVYLYGAEWTIEAATEDTAKRAAAAGKLAAFVVDSIQAVNSTASMHADSPRGAVMANVKAIRKAARKHKMLMLSTSEANRNSYQNEATAKQSNDMAAGSESSAIEYLAQTQLVLRTPKGLPNYVHVKVPKNRRGTVTAFECYMRLDRTRHALTECADPTVGDAGHEAQVREDKRTASNRAELRRDAEALAKVVAAHPGCGSRELRGFLLAAGHRWGPERLTAAQETLKPGVGGLRLVDRLASEKNRCAWHIEPISSSSDV